MRASHAPFCRWRFTRPLAWRRWGVGVLASLTSLLVPTGMAFASAQPYPVAPLPALIQPVVPVLPPTGARPPVVRAQAVWLGFPEGVAPLFVKNADQVMPIASLSKLMAAMVLLDEHLALTDTVAVTSQDLDEIRHSRSHLPIGTVARRVDLLHVALLASDNRATYALARTSLGGTQDFVARMNRKAHDLGMSHTHFNDPTGLDGGNVSTVQDLAKMANAAFAYPAIRAFTRSAAFTLVPTVGRSVEFRNTDDLVRAERLPIDLSKTGFINEAGHCLILRWTVRGQPVVMTLLDAPSSSARADVAERLNAWLLGTDLPPPVVQARSPSHARVHVTLLPRHRAHGPSKRST